MVGLAGREAGTAPAAAKAALKTMEGVNGTAALEPKKPRPRKIQSRGGDCPAVSRFQRRECPPVG